MSGGGDSTGSASVELRAWPTGCCRRLSTLTPREREVLPLVVSGLLNKQAAVELGISEVTLQIHRGKIMRKARSRKKRPVLLADLEKRYINAP